MSVARGAAVALVLGLAVACGDSAGKQGVPEAAGATEQVGNLTFQRDDSAARRLARSQGKPLFIDFYADWCVNCKLWAKLAVKDQRLNAALKQAVLLKVYDTDPVFQSYQNDSRFPELKVGLPFFLVLAADGSVRYKSQNYKDVDGMIRAILAGG